MQGAFDGVGIQLGYKNQILTVMSPLKDMPAAKAGVQAGDLILRIKDEKKNIDKDTAGISLPDSWSYSWCAWDVCETLFSEKAESRKKKSWCGQQFWFHQ